MGACPRSSGWAPRKHKDPCTEEGRQKVRGPESGTVRRQAATAGFEDGKRALRQETCSRQELGRARKQILPKILWRNSVLPTPSF